MKKLGKKKHVVNLNFHGHVIPYEMKSDFVQMGLGEILALYRKWLTQPWWKRGLWRDFALEDIENILDDVTFEIEESRLHYALKSADKRN